MGSLTLAFAEHLQGLWRSGLDGESRQRALMLVIDGLAVAALGSGEAAPRHLTAVAARSEARPVAGFIGQGARGSAAEAARANGSAMHVLDFEPMWNPANHSLSTVLPAVVALAESAARRQEPLAGVAGSDTLGEGLLLALAVGIEAQARLRLSSGQFEPGELTFHPPGVVGSIGSAAACGLLLGLEGERLAHALGIAASRAGGLQQNIGSHTKSLHCGQSAASGLESALLAAEGFTADADALGGPRGYGKAFYRDGFRPEALCAPAETLHIVEPGPAFKLFPSQYGTHFVITCALDAHRQLAARSKAPVRSVTVTMPSMPYVDRPAPASGLAGKFSFQYATAVALLDGAVGVGSFTDRRRFADDLEALLPRISLREDKSRQGRFDRLVIDMAVELEDGTAVATRCNGPPGIWGRPLAPEALEAKARDCLGAAYGEAAGAATMALLPDFGSLDGGGLCRLMDELTRLPAAR